MSTPLLTNTIAPREDLWSYVARARPNIESSLLRYLPVAPADVDASFNDALRYALFPGGKRLRPVLTLLGAEAIGGHGQDVLAAAAAVEFVHTSSLIFDDLPCMDDAQLRRGRLSLHVRYGEGAAVLVALALMNASYGLLFENAVTSSDIKRAMSAHKELVECIGARGMVAGQSLDLAEHKSLHVVSSKDADAMIAASDERESYETVRNLKTSALMRLALRTGAQLCGATSKQLAALSRFAELIGDAYQTGDDVLDIQEDAAVLANHPQQARRATFAIEQGAQHAMQRVHAFTNEAKRVLHAELGSSSAVQLLCEVADYITTREE